MDPDTKDTELPHKHILLGYAGQRRDSRACNPVILQIWFVSFILDLVMMNLSFSRKFHIGFSNG